MTQTRAKNSLIHCIHLLTLADLQSSRMAAELPLQTITKHPQHGTGKIILPEYIPAEPMNREFNVQTLTYSNKLNVADKCLTCQSKCKQRPVEDQVNKQMRLTALPDMRAISRS